MAYLNGRELLAEGREAEIYVWENNCVLRLMRTPEQRFAMERSSIASEAARASGVSTPAVVDTVEIGGRPAQVIERIDGPDGFAALASSPWRILSIARAVGAAHAHLHSVKAPDGLESLHDRFRRRIQTSSAVPTRFVKPVLEALERLPEGTSLCHGDYHPGNVLLADSGPVIIDWTGATRGDAMADHARTLLMLSMGELPPGSPWLIRTLSHVGRGVLISIYRRSYRKSGKVDPVLLDRWTSVSAAERLTDEVESERADLLEVVSAAFG